MTDGQVETFAKVQIRERLKLLNAMLAYNNLREYVWKKLYEMPVTPDETRAYEQYLAGFRKEFGMTSQNFAAEEVIQRLGDYVFSLEGTIARREREHAKETDAAVESSPKVSGGK